MQQAYDTLAPKQATNISINSRLLAKASDLNINLSVILEAALAELVSVREREGWLAENHASIAQYNDFVDKNGVFSDGLAKNLSLFC
jgi:antitoxin CcdA